MSELRWIVRDIGAPVLIILIFFVLTFCLVIRLNYEECQQYERMTGRQTDWGLFTQCVILVDGVYYTREEYKAIITARDGLRDD